MPKTLHRKGFSRVRAGGQGKKFSSEWMNFGTEKNYEVIDGRSLFEHYLWYPTLPRDHFEIRTMGIVGSMGSGKSASIRFVVRTLKEIYGGDFDVVLTDSLHLALENISNKPLQCIIIDDAITKGQDSRRSVSAANVDTTQTFFLIRHVCEEVAVEGVVFIIFAYQDIGGIDIRFRRNLDYCFFKSYIDDRKLDHLLNDDEEAVGLLKMMTREDIHYHNYDYRGICVGVAKWGDLMYLKFPEVKASELQIPVLSGISKRNEIKARAQDWLLASELLKETTKKDVLYGMLMAQIGETNFNNYNFRTADLTEIIRKASAEHFLIEQEEAREAARVHFELMAEKKDVRSQAITWLIKSGYIAHNLDKGTYYGLLQDFLEEDYYRLHFKTKDFTEILRVARAKFFKQNPDLFQDPTAENYLRDGMARVLTVLLHDVKGLSFKQIEEDFGIPHSTAQRHYNDMRDFLNALPAKSAPTS